MQFCDTHWTNLRTAIDARGLSALVAETGQDAMVKTMRQFEGEDTIDSFEPVLMAHTNIAANAMGTISRAGGNPLYLLATGPEDPVEGQPGRTWPRCPICYLGLAHEISCDGNTGCKLPRKDGYAWMIDRAADDALAKWESLRG